MVPRSAFACAGIAALAAAAPSGITAGQSQISVVVTGVNDPSGALVAPASVGATVSGFFQYDPSPHHGVDHLDPHVTADLNPRLSSGSSCRTSRCS